MITERKCEHKDHIAQWLPKYAQRPYPKASVKGVPNDKLPLKGLTGIDEPIHFIIA
jgi:hypothetical protein